MQINELLKKDFFISTDKTKIDVDTVHHYLCTESYWSKNIPLHIVKTSIDNSFCFGVYKNASSSETIQVGFARVVTDKATFGYLADVFIAAPYRGIGLSKWLMEEILNHPELQGFRSWMLGTLDAHGLYERFGFKLLENNERIMRLGLMAGGYPDGAATI